MKRPNAICKHCGKEIKDIAKYDDAEYWVHVMNGYKQCQLLSGKYTPSAKPHDR